MDMCGHSGNMCVSVFYCHYYEEKLASPDKNIKYDSKKYEYSIMDAYVLYHIVILNHIIFQ